jgi:hypothetical protein
MREILTPSLRANGSRERALKTGSAKQSIAQQKKEWIASLRSQLR